MARDTEAQDLPMPHDGETFAPKDGRVRGAHTDGVLEPVASLSVGICEGRIVVTVRPQGYGAHVFLHLSARDARALAVSILSTELVLEDTHAAAREF